VVFQYFKYFRALGFLLKSDGINVIKSVSASEISRIMLDESRVFLFRLTKAELTYTSLLSTQGAYNLAGR